MEGFTSSIIKIQVKVGEPRVNFYAIYFLLIVTTYNPLTAAVVSPAFQRMLRVSDLSNLSAANNL
jgi:hypothetical protein